jgi:hypothetical protein
MATSRPNKYNTKCLSVRSAHRVTKQLALQPYRFQAVHQPQQRDTAARTNNAIGSIVLCVKDFLCNSQSCALSEILCISLPSNGKGNEETLHSVTNSTVNPSKPKLVLVVSEI